MAKNLKLNIKNAQIAQAINLGNIKTKLAEAKEKEKPETEKADTPPTPATSEVKSSDEAKKGDKEETPKEETPRIRARSKSAFSEPVATEPKVKKSLPEAAAPPPAPPLPSVPQWVEESMQELAAMAKSDIILENPLPEQLASEDIPIPRVPELKKEKTPHADERPDNGVTKTAPQRQHPQHHPAHQQGMREHSTPPPPPQRQKLGPTGRHIKDLLPPPRPRQQPAAARGHHEERRDRDKERPVKATPADIESSREKEKDRGKAKAKFHPNMATDLENSLKKGGAKGVKPKEFRDLKPARRQESSRFDARDKQGLRVQEEAQTWRKRKSKSAGRYQVEETVRPTALNVRLPITIKDLAAEMKLKASQLIAKLFMQGMVLTLNDSLEDETVIQLLGQEFGCNITIDTSEEERIRITDKTIRTEIADTPADKLLMRPPVVTFMGHVDHGKTSLIDAIRKSNRVSGEAGAITQHIGAFRCHTPVGDIAILDTPGHEAFSAMRARGADVTDIVVLVVAGDEGIRAQTEEAIQHAKAAGVIIIVAINKCDKPGFNVEQVYRQLAEKELLPEAWGGQTITVNCSAVTNEGISELLEMLALQSEVLELRANPSTRARGSVLESELNKGMGAVATILVQNGTLHIGDALVFGQHFGRVKTMRDENGDNLTEALPSTPVEVTGLSGLPHAGEEFIVVKSEKEAKDIAEARSWDLRKGTFQAMRKVTVENMFQQANDGVQKVLNVILRADVQGSLEALKVALQKITSDKVDLNIIFTGVGEISEADIQLASASKAIVVGFHTQLESHAEMLVKQMGIQVRLHDVIYHAIDDVKLLMAGTLDKIAQEEERGKVIVKATFKSSQAGIIAGCQVIEGSIHRNHYVRVIRGKEQVWKGQISSLKRVKEDVREVQKGVECGIVFNGFSDIQEDDIIESYDIVYIEQQL